MRRLLVPLMLSLAACSDVTISSSNAPPSVVVLSPVDGASQDWGADLVFCALAEDPGAAEDGSDLTYLLTSSADGVLWSSDDGTDPIGASCDAGLEGNVSLTLEDLSEGEHVLNLTVWDEYGASAEDSVTLAVVRPGNAAPSCTLLAPPAGTVVFEGDGVSLAAQTEDDQPTDQLLSAWTSSIDGDLGAGALDAAGLATLEVEAPAPGQHFFTLQVEDVRGATGACGVLVEVVACVDDDGDGFTNCDGDCDDSEPAVYPGAVEEADGLDNDCNGAIDDGTVLSDDDGDGYAEFQGDCDDADPAVHPGAPEDDGTGGPTDLDNDCDGTADEGTTGFDDDGDGYCEGGTALGCTDGTLEGDCDDTTALIAPDQVELVCDGVDQDCSTATQDAPDADTDGWDACDPAEPGDLDGLAADCLDTNGLVFPGATELVCDGLDQDCDGIADDAPDDDVDGWDVCASADPGDLDGLPADCDDANPAVAPGLPETADSVDQDCDGLVDEGTDAYDDDLDGYCEAGCTDGSLPGDCDDTTPNISPAALELPNGIDDDCDGVIDDGTVLVDDDGDGYSEAQLDCDDADPAVHPGAVELADGIDNDCDGIVDEGTDAFDDDLDGATELDGDCDDADPTRYPGAPEGVCDGVDQDCDGFADESPDLDGDGYDACGSADAYDGDTLPVDCAEADAAIHPGAVEALCDGVDQDCDGVADDAPDGDGDGWDVCASTDPGDLDGLPVDCDDTDAAIAPGLPEVADGVDQDCDSLVDEGTAAYDDDQDGYCEAGCTDGSLPGDCDDTTPNISPAVAELPNGIDDDCDGVVDDGTVLADDDGDGYSEAQLDCDDADPAVHPGAVELADGIDNDCDGIVDEGTVAFDDDLDGATELDGDCDDADPTRYPGAPEGLCDGVDQDCDGLGDESPDVDGDGYDGCGSADAYDGDGLPVDCSDTVASIHPNAIEVACDGVDQDCDGFADDAVDADGDGFDVCAPTDPGDLDGVLPDCDDTDVDIWPGAAELVDGVDQDCDGLVDEGTTAADDDGDGFCEAACTDGSTPGDCDDSSAVVYPGAPELIDGLDNDCNGTVDDNTSVADDDGDGFAEVDGDCNDASTLVYPNAPEDLTSGGGQGDGIDNDCDGFVDEGTLSYDDDGDGYCESGCTDGSVAGDCDDTAFLISPDVDEVCGDGVDNDCDGTIDLPDNDDDGSVDALCGGDDCDDADAAVFPGATEVFDTADNDCDGVWDEGFISPGMIVITEIMRNPDAVSDVLGEYFEVFNPGADPINLNGWYVADLDGNDFTVSSDVIVEAGGRAVLGTNDDFGSNGGYYPDFVYPYSAVGGMQLANGSDEIVLEHDALEIDRVEYGGGWPAPTGASIELSESTLDSASNDNDSNWCTASTALPAGDDGTPGLPGGC